MVGWPKRAEPGGGSAGEAGERAGCGERGRGPCSVELGCSAGSGEGLGCLSGFGPGLVGLLGLDFLFSFSFLILVPIQTQPKLVEFKLEFEFHSKTQTIKTNAPA